MDHHPGVAALPGAAGLLELPRVRSEAQAAEQGYALVLDYFPEGLGLKVPAGPERPLVVDFVGGRQGWRAGHDRARHELVVRACLGREPAQDVIDATAGLGRDAFMLAAVGARVTLVERSPVLVAMLRDGCLRLARQDEALAAQLTIVEGDAAEVLPRLQRAPDTVLLDPMFPERSKRAAVKKDLTFLQTLAAPPDEEEERRLLDLSLATGCRRVVVKRPHKAPFLGGQRPAHQLQGKAVRFDIYPGQARP